MPAQLPGYEYDVFISYRHNDNRSGWVSDFVQNLQQELAATIKDPVSVYFDSNPTDGIRETDHVDKSLEGKLKCLIFIPILSQTYCDPKSFAWQHEFLAFNKLASDDDLGRDVRLKNGNFTSRILPVRIHDLDPEDQAVLQQALGGVLRAIDFTYKEPGINRPLRPENSEVKNANKTSYSDQVNKVANTIKEILASLRQPVVTAAEPVRVVKPIPVSTKRPLSEMKLLILAGVVILMLAVAYGSTFFTKGESAAVTNETEIDRSIAVLPFADMSASKDQEYFSDGLSEELLNLLAKIPDLKVISRTSAFSFKGKNDDIRSIADKLGVAYLLEGSVRKSMDKVRITAQLIRASDGSHVWSENYDREMNDIFKVQDEIAEAVVNQLKVKLLGADRPSRRESKPDVYNLWLQAKFYAGLGTKEGYKQELKTLEQAILLDSTDARIWSQLSNYYTTISGNVDASSIQQIRSWSTKAKTLAEKAVALDPNLPDAYWALGIVLTNNWDFEEAERQLVKGLALDPNNYFLLHTMATIKSSLGKFDEAETLYKRTMKLDPVRPTSFVSLGLVLMATNRFDEASTFIQKALTLTPRPTYYLYVSELDLLAGKPDKALIEIGKVENEFWKDYGTILCLWSLNRKAECDAKLKTFENQYGDVGAYQVAEIYAWRGDKEKTFQWLERAYITHDPGMADIKASVLLKPLRDDPRYKAMLEKVKLPQ